MTAIQDFLASSPLALLTLVIAIGYGLGEVRLPGNFRFGMAAILFVGLAFGFWHPELGKVIPETLQTFGLTMFLYCIGLEAGPGFFRALGKTGLKVNLAGVACLVLTTVVVWMIARHGFAGGNELLAGAWCGLWNNTPALAAAADTVRARSTDPALAGQVVVGYGAVYPFSLIALLLMYHFLCRRAFGPEAVSKPPAVEPEEADTLKVTRLPEGRDFWLAREIHERTGLLLSRVFHTEKDAEVVKGSTEIHEGARVVAVGTRRQMEAGAALLGRFSEGTFETRQKGFSIHRYSVSNPKILGRPLQQVTAELEALGSALTRVRRGDVELTANPGIRLLPGDRVRVVAPAGSEREIRRYFGDSLHALGAQGSMTFVLGIFLGLLLGSIPIPVPGLDAPLKLGAAGGPLVMALLLGRLGRTGPLVWSLPFSNNLTLRHLGIALFFAAVGCRAGGGLGAVLNLQGLILIGTGVTLTVLAHLLFMLFLRMAGVKDLPSLMGMSAGLQTQPAALTFAHGRAPGDAVPVSYATVFPLALVTKILLAQILVLTGH